MHLCDDDLHSEDGPPTHLVEWRWQAALMDFDTASCEAAVAALLNGGADPNAPVTAADGDRPLHLACARARQGWPAAGAVRLLLAGGAAPAALNSAGHAPLHAVLREPLSQAALAALEALLQGGASPSLPCAGVPPLCLAAGFADGATAVRVMAALLGAGARVDAAAAADGATPLHFAARNPHLYWPPSSGSTVSGSTDAPGSDSTGQQRAPVVRAKRSAGADAIAFLARAGANPAAVDRAGLQPLAACAAAAHACAPAAAAVVAALAAAGADLDAPDGRGRPPLAHAMTNPSPAGRAAIQALTEAGASPAPLLARLRRW